jgi:hypothetical protein
VNSSSGNSLLKQIFVLKRVEKECDDHWLLEIINRMLNLLKYSLSIDIGNIFLYNMLSSLTLLRKRFFLPTNRFDVFLTVRIVYIVKVSTS